MNFFLSMTVSNRVLAPMITTSIINAHITIRKNSPKYYLLTLYRVAFRIFIQNVTSSSVWLGLRKCIILLGLKRTERFLLGLKQQNATWSSVFFVNNWCLGPSFLNLLLCTLLLHFVRCGAIFLPNQTWYDLPTHFFYFCV